MLKKGTRTHKGGWCEREGEDEGCGLLWSASTLPGGLYTGWAATEALESGGRSPEKLSHREVWRATMRACHRIGRGAVKNSRLAEARDFGHSRIDGGRY